MTKKLNKKGTSLVELIAVIVIMGIIAAIAIPTTVGVINRQKKKAAVESANSAFSAAKTVLLEASTMADSGASIGVSKLADAEVYYIDAEALKTNGHIDSKVDVKLADTDKLYFIYDGTKFTILVGASVNAMPTEPTVKVTIDGVDLTFTVETGKFAS